MIFRRRKIDPYREGIQALYSVKLGMSKIEALLDRIKNRRHRMMEVAAELQMRGETFLAKKYAEEIAKLDKISARLQMIHLVLEKVALSLEYAMTVHNFQGIAKEVLEITRDLKKLPESTIPDMGLMLYNLEESLKAIANSGANAPDYSLIDMSPSTDENTEKILKEAKEILKSRLTVDAA